MVQKTTGPQAGPSTQANVADARPPEVADLLGKVGKLLEEGQPAAALGRIGSSGLSSPWLANAAGVCQLRPGHYLLARDERVEIHSFWDMDYPIEGDKSSAPIAEQASDLRKLATISVWSSR